MDRPLTTKTKPFVSAYLISGNATDAARKAGYKGNAKTLGAVGLENLAKPRIAEQITKRVEDAIITTNEWLTEVAELARNAEKDSDRLTAYGLLGKPLNLTNNSNTNATVTIKIGQIIRPKLPELTE